MSSVHNLSTLVTQLTTLVSRLPSLVTRLSTLFLLCACRSPKTLQTQITEEQHTHTQSTLLDSLVKDLTVRFDSLTLVLEYPVQEAAAPQDEVMSGGVEFAAGSINPFATLTPFSLSGLSTSPGMRLTLTASHASVSSSTAHIAAATADSTSASSTSRDHSSVVVSRASTPQRGAAFRSFLRGAACGAVALLALLLIYRFRRPLLHLLKQIFRKST